MSDEEDSSRINYEPLDRHGERLARLENDTAWIRKTVTEIKHNLEGGGNRMDSQDARLESLENELVRIKTHLGWMKAIWGLLWAVILVGFGWLAERVWK